MSFRSPSASLAPALALAAIVTVGCGKPPARPPQTPEAGFVVMHAQAQPLTTELPGRITPLAISEVRPQVNGIVLQRLFTEGSTVRKGQPLYRIDPRTYQAAVDQAKAQLANVEASLAGTSLKAQRYADLVKINAVSKQDFDDAQALARQGAANVEQAKAALETAEINLGYTDIRAPISGRIGVSTITQGALATAGQTNPLTVIQTLDPVYVDVTQSSAELLRLERSIQGGQVKKDAPLSAKVKLTLEDGSTYPLEGKLQFTDVTVDPSSGAVTIRAVFPNPQGTLLPGMFVRAVVTEAVAPDAILVPQQAVSRDAKGGATVLVVNDQNKAELRPIQVAQAVDSNWLATKGLSPGDRVISEGLQRIQAGMTVRPVPAGSAPSRPAAAAPGQGPQGGGRP